MMLAQGTEPTPYNIAFNNLFKNLGISINPIKDRIHTTNEFLDIELDIILMEARLPSEKLTKAIELVNKALEKKSISIENLQSLVSFLAFAIKVVIPDKAFLKRLYDVLSAERSKIRILRKNRPIIKI